MIDALKIAYLGIAYQWGNLVKLVICVSAGQLKFEIANFMINATFLCFLPFSIVLSLKNAMGNLIAPLTNFL